MDRELEVMTALRLPPLGKLVVKVGNHRYEKLEELPVGPLRQRVLAAIGELVSFAGGYDTLVEAGLAPAIRPTETPEAIQERQEAFLQTLSAPSEEPATPTSRRPSLTGRATPPPPPPMQTDIAAQINAILQRHLQATPEMAGRRVRLIGGASGTLQIEVDGRFYASPGQIPDSAVQLLLKKALRDWDQK
ncbi:MAG: hypothetical protein KC418_10635 [Anaerolineales bacterium]|nr:hypothetical protein [Anaerolineales bacterium]MCB8952081.1 hypothetical protein [Ardenticatenales bacterium]